jgi:hypothetical protein
MDWLAASSSSTGAATSASKMEQLEKEQSGSMATMVA